MDSVIETWKFDLIGVAQAHADESYRQGKRDGRRDVIELLEQIVTNWKESLLKEEE